MVWRTSYSTVTAVDVVPPSLCAKPLSGVESVSLGQPGIWIVGFGLGSLSAVEVWLRLCRSDLPDCRPFRVVVVGPEREMADLPSLVPPSRLGDTHISSDEEAWADWLGSERPTVLAAVSDGTVWPIVMAGRPTEEAWDAFVAVARRQTSSD